MPRPQTLTILDHGRVLAREYQGMLRIPNSDNLKRYTAFISWRGEEDCEEIDVDAVNREYARECVERLLKRDYEPGGVIRHLEERFGMYL